jgi:hypothetical protein
MPFKSQAQRAYAHVHKDQPWAKKFIQEDPGGKLPYKVGDKTKRKRVANSLRKGKAT